MESTCISTSARRRALRQWFCGFGCANRVSPTTDDHGSLEDQMPLRSLTSTDLVASRARAFSCVICVVFAVLGCASETQERPRDARRATSSHDIKPSAAPFPSTAFLDPSEGGSGAPQAATSVDPSRSSTTSNSSADRFSTRTIGEHGDGQAAGRFHGAPVDLDLKDANVHDVFRLLADVGRVNIVVAGEVTGTVTMRLRKVPWDQAMDVIARARGLVYEREGNVILVRAQAPSSTKP